MQSFQFLDTVLPDTMWLVVSMVGVGIVAIGIIYWSWLAIQPTYGVTYHDGKWRRRIGWTVESYYVINDCNIQPKDIDICAFAQILASKQEISCTIMQAAVERLAGMHPLLQARYLKQGSAHYFEQMEDFRIAFTISEETDWKEVFEDQLLTSYDIHAGPLWRAVFLPQVSVTDDQLPVKDSTVRCHCALVFGFHHSIIDGKSYIYLLEDLVRILNDFQTSTDSKWSINELGSFPVPPPHEDFLPGLRKSWIDVAVKVLCRIGLIGDPRFSNTPKRERNIEENAWLKKFGAEIQRNPACDVRTRIIPMTFDPVVTRGLRAASRRNRTTVTTVIQVVLSIAMVEMLQDGEITEDMTISACPTVSLRPFATKDVVKTALASFSFVPIDIPVTAEWRTEFWDICRKSPVALHPEDLFAKCKEILKLFGREAAFTEFGINRRHYEEALGSTLRRYGTLSMLTNVGDCSRINAGRDSVKVRARFAGGALHRYGPIFSHCVCTIDDVMSWGVLYYPNITSESVAQDYVSRIKRILKQIVQN